MAIIGVLIGLLVPGLSMVRRQALANKSQNNLKQWGAGTLAYANSQDERLPWEGKLNPVDMPTNMANPAWWANAVGPLVGAGAYKDLSERAFQDGTPVPFADGESIFIDPAAQPENPEPYSYQGQGPGGLPHQWYFNYVPNTALNNTLTAGAANDDFAPDKIIRLGNLHRPEVTVLMLEMRANASEVNKNDPYRTLDLTRQGADWKRFAGRHFRGGHMVFGDGHVGWMLNDEATTNSKGSRDPAYPNGDWNVSKIVWDPLGPALYNAND